MVVILGLVPRIQRSARHKLRNRSDARQCRIQIDPVRIGALDQVDLPRPYIVLEGLLALDRLANIGEFLEPDEVCTPYLRVKADPLPDLCCSMRVGNPFVTPM